MNDNVYYPQAEQVDSTQRLPLSRVVLGTTRAIGSRGTSLNVRQNMIDWRITPDSRGSKNRMWFFPTFEIQEYLLPQINVGKTLIDPYGATSFSAEDCLRLSGNIEYLMDNGGFDLRQEIRFDSIEKGLVVLSCEQIKGCLLNLHQAATEVLECGGTLVFYGD